MNTRYSKPIFIAALVLIIGLSGFGLLTSCSKKSAKEAVYIARPNEIASTPIWDHNQILCGGKPYNSWGIPGTYLYRNENGKVFSMILHAGDPMPTFGVNGPDAPGFSGIETITTELGTFQAALLSASKDYSMLTGRLDYLKGSYQRSEWYVCGYGLIKLTASESGSKTPGDFSYSNSWNITLLSFTPLTTNESHVRYILTDIQLGKLAKYYHDQIPDEETAEALRRWDAGVRVVNIKEFARSDLNGQWRIVHIGTTTPADGMELKLTSDMGQ